MIKHKLMQVMQERRTKNLVSGNLAGGISLSDLAHACGLSVRHFTRAFRQSTAMAPHQWLLDHRIERAKDFLAKSRFPLKDIALSCGFADQSHFSRAFRRRVGVSPGLWRRMRRNSPV